MEKTVRSQVIKWQLILCAVVCAIVAFCALPGVVIAASAKTETVEYVDRVWNEETNQVDTITTATDEKGNTLTDENGNPLSLTHECTVLTKDMCGRSGGLGERGKETWYVLNSNITYKAYQSIRIKDGADVHLILKDGCTLTATKHDAIQVYDGSMLTIYGQSGGTGKIVVDGQSGHAGIGVDASSILNIKGGVIEADGTGGGAGIGGNDGESTGIINIYGGNVTAKGESKYGPGIGSGDEGSGGIVTIFGGTVKAIGGDYAAGIGSGDQASSNKGTVSIVGGNVIAKGGKKGAGIGGGNETAGGTILIGGGDIKAYGGRCGAGIGGGDDASSGVITIDAGYIFAKGGEEAPGIGGDSEGTKKETGFVTINGGEIKALANDGKGDKQEEGLYDIGDEEVVIDIAEGVSINGGDIETGVEFLGIIYGSIAPQNRKPVTYIDRTYDEEIKQVIEEEKVCTGYKSLSKEICARGAGLTTGWYVLDSSITHNDAQSIRIKDGANVHLILKDGCTLTATENDGIQIDKGSYLTIYGQNEGTGKIVAEGKKRHAGIGVDSTSALEIKGGDIEAQGNMGGAGIGGNRGGSSGIISICRATVKASGEGKNGGGAGIGGGGSDGGCVGSCGLITIYDSNVEATGGLYAAGIGNGGDHNADLSNVVVDKMGAILIDGGSVTAKGGKKGAGIGGGNGRAQIQILINDGDINAYGGDCGAGIGGVNDAGTGDITVIDGNIEAIGGKNASGIGGYNGETDFIVIAGGQIKVEGQDGEYDIGNNEIFIDIKEGVEIKDDAATHTVKGTVEQTDVELKEEVETDGIKGQVIGSVAPGRQNTTSVTYIDRELKEDGKIEETTKECKSYIPLTENICKDGLGAIEAESWYVLTSNINYEEKGSIYVTGDVNLILEDGYEFKGNEKTGIYLTNGATLTVYGQENGTGKINVDCSEGGAGIRVSSNSTFNVKGGNISAKGAVKCAGIGGCKNEAAGAVNIYGGRVTANGGENAAGIGGGGYEDEKSATEKAGLALFGIGSGISITGILAVFVGLFLGAFSSTETIMGFFTVSLVLMLIGAVPLLIGSFMMLVCYTPIKNDCGGGSTAVYGGTIEVIGGNNAPSIGAGYGGKGGNGTLTVSGGTIKGENVKGTDLPKHTITLDGVKEEVEVVGVNIDYGVNDVYTLDKGKLYFYMTEDEYEKLTEITVKDKDGKEDTYYKTEDPNVFSNKQTVNITGVEAQHGIYSGLPQIGYRGTPTNKQGYEGEYETAYYLSGGGKTTPENSGAEGEGKAPVYAGEYKVRIAVPSSNKDYGGYCDVEFKVEKATPEIIKEPSLSGVYGTAVKDMSVVVGLVMVGNMYEPGIWEVTDERGTDIPEVGTTEAYEVTFTPIDTRNINSLTTMVVPEVIEIPTMSEPSVDLTFDKTNKEKLIDKLKEKLSNPEVKAKLLEPEVRNNIKEKLLNDELIKAYKTKDNLKELFSNNPELRDKVRDKITNSELIEDEAVREKLLSFIEE